MEKLLNQDLDEVDKKNKEQEMLANLEGEEIKKQRNFAKDLEKMVVDIRKDRDYKTINKVLGQQVHFNLKFINKNYKQAQQVNIIKVQLQKKLLFFTFCLIESFIFQFFSSLIFKTKQIIMIFVISKRMNIEKPVDEVIDLEKIKAEFALEQMYKRNQELFDKADDLFKECNYYVDEEGNHHNVFKEETHYDKEYEVEKYLKKIFDFDENEDEEEDNNSNENESNYINIDNKKLGFSKNTSMLTQSIMADSQLMYGSTNMNSSQRVRFEKMRQSLTPEEMKKRDFYRYITKKINIAEDNLIEKSEYDPNIKITQTDNQYKNKLIKVKQTKKERRSSQLKKHNQNEASPLKKTLNKGINK